MGKETDNEKVKISGYVSKKSWNRFLQKVFQKHGKTSGGAISSSIEEALTSYTQQ